MKAFAIVISGLLLTMPAAAQIPGGGAERPTNTGDERARGSDSNEATDPNRRICRRIETNTGSRVPFRRVCLTERQWEAYRRQD